MNVTLLLCCLLLVPGLASGQWHGTVVKVASADNYQVEKPSGKTVDVRLYGIACPKSDQPYGNEATIKTANKLLNRKVKVKEVETGLYDRIIGKVFHKSIMINQWLIQKGYAWVFDKYCKKPICKHWKRIQERKKAAEIGLWSNDNPTPPWNYQN